MDKLSISASKIATLREHLELDNRMLKTQAQSDPTSFIRTLSNDPFWVAEQAGSGYLIGYPCKPVTNISWRKIANKTCQQRVPAATATAVVYKSQKEEDIDELNPLISDNNSGLNSEVPYWYIVELRVTNA